jgi:competence protein ComEA
MKPVTRVAAVAAALGLAAFCIWHPAPSPPVLAVQPSPHDALAGAHDRASRRFGAGDATPDPVVYVAGAVRRPGLYHLRAGDRAGDAIQAAGEETASADPWAVNRAARVRDGDEIFVPERGAAEAPAVSAKRARRERATPEPDANVDVNAADVPVLARVPGIGRAVAARIVELRERDGPYASLDELLDVAGMSQARLERARPFLRPP